MTPNHAASGNFFSKFLLTTFKGRAHCLEKRRRPITRIGLYSQSARSEDGFDEPKGFISGKEPFG
jgi:hypothetical protein